MADYKFLNQASQYYLMLKSVENFYETNLNQRIIYYNEQVEDIKGLWLEIALKSLELTPVIFAMKNAKEFFNSFEKITTYEGFCLLLNAFFLSNKIIITNIAPAVINIYVENANQDLLKKYQDMLSNIYQDRQNNDYQGFSTADISSLGEFFKLFLNKFLPAGIILNEIEIAGVAKPENVTLKYSQGRYKNSKGQYRSKNSDTTNNDTNLGE